MVSPTAVAGAIALAEQVGSKAAQIAQSPQASAMAANLKGESLVSLANYGRVEPVVMLDNEVTNQPYISDVLQTCQSLFAGYYLQAINMINVIDNVTVRERLAPFNPNQGMGFESYDKLGRKDKRYGLLSKRTAAFEADNSDDKKADTPPPTTNMTSVGDKVLENVQLAANLSIGKMYNVTMRSNGQCYAMPVAIRLLVNILPSTMLTKLFTYRDAFDMSLKERWHAWKEGRLTLGDLVLCTDLIDKYRRMAITDKSGLGEKILNREAGIVKNALGHGIPSVSNAVNIAVIGDKTLGQIEAELAGRFSNSKVRRAIFENTNLMFLVVIDTAWDRVTFYTRGLDNHTTLSIKDIKAANKDSGPDVVEIMRAYMLGAAPQSI